MIGTWLMGLQNKWHEYQLLGILRPKYMTNTTWKKLLQQHAILEQAGWDHAAVKGYYRFIGSQVNHLTDDIAIQEKLRYFEKQIQLIGSETYNSLYRASKLVPRKRIQLVFQQLRAQRDSHGFLQIQGTYKIDPKLSPLGIFLELFRHDVQEIFPHQTLGQYADIATNSDGQLRELAAQVHCFRSYLDYQCLCYIRNYQHGITDYDKLLDFASQYQVELDYQTGANFHNRYENKFTYPQNMKVQLPKREKMVEFIVNLTTEDFVSEWNVYHYLADGQIDSNPENYTNEELEQIANTESFNYGRPQHKTHAKLDIEHPTDPDLRQTATRIWHYEPDFDDGGNYADIVNRGGQADVTAWKLIPLVSRQRAYDDYVTECRKLNLRREYGFDSFYRGVN